MRTRSVRRRLEVAAPPGAGRPRAASPRARAGGGPRAGSARSRAGAVAPRPSPASARGPADRSSRAAGRSSSASARPSCSARRVELSAPGSRSTPRGELGLARADGLEHVRARLHEARELAVLRGGGGGQHAQVVDEPRAASRRRSAIARLTRADCSSVGCVAFSSARRSGPRPFKPLAAGVRERRPGSGACPRRDSRAPRPS